MLLKVLNFFCLMLLLSLAQEDLRSQQVGLHKILLLSLAAWLQWLLQTDSRLPFGQTLASSLFFCLLVFLVRAWEKAQERFYLGAADLLVLAALAPLEGLWACLVLAALASVFCLLTMGFLVLISQYGLRKKAQPTKKGQDTLALPLLPFYCLAWLLLPLVV